MKILRRTLISFGVLAMLVAPATAFAGDPSTGTAGGILSGGGSGGAGGTGGTLPFTGLNLALILIAAFALVTTGIVLRRRSNSNET
jgi:hypothetical protein